MRRTQDSLRPSPFRNAGEGPCFFASATHQEALARLHFLVRQGRSLGILTGDDGTGKSLVLARFLDEARHSGQPACGVNLPGLEPRDFLWELAAGLCARPRAGDDVFSLWRRISDRLRENQLLNRNTAIVLDDADEAAHEVLIFVLRLLKSHPAGMTLTLAADPAATHAAGRRSAAAFAATDPPGAVGSRRRAGVLADQPDARRSRSGPLRRLRRRAAARIVRRPAALGHPPGRTHLAGCRGPRRGQHRRRNGRFRVPGAERFLSRRAGGCA